MNLQEGGGGGAKNRYRQSKYHKISAAMVSHPHLKLGTPTKNRLLCVCGGSGGCIGKSVWGTLLKEAMMRSRI